MAVSHKVDQKQNSVENTVLKMGMLNVVGGGKKTLNHGDHGFCGGGKNKACFRQYNTKMILKASSRRHSSFLFFFLIIFNIPAGTTVCRLLGHC